MIDLFLVATGGFLGAISRSIISKKLNNKFPLIYLGTFVVNILGSLLLGFLVNIHLYTSVNLFIGIGFLGSFTTFSTFKVENITLIQSKQNKQFLIYLFLTYIIGILFAFIGFWIARIYLGWG
ncbi:MULTISPECIES: fluoride efflux transporter FluC [Bacillaceae]|uniref:Fluoride-specific ion channel FluC n=1 Tax=Oceanobacillus caeni TaxID=405946 RepID=A0ABR5MKY5_9BACI|nr:MULTISPECIES: CrcB family protein [Bacillaceae]KKE80053.1 membrane protein [Bacilli bacterium VT-13-104]PZD86424.1 CrcB family protein [Bacilli bacterium]KPH76563.1 membrane protein [Oceanobacillus caeni]MED4473584.1 CrcB family protein [Oceanobacillus caeni]PZD88074.1 CrcB family protein [Bacilli bacterium]